VQQLALRDGVKHDATEEEAANGTQARSALPLRVQSLRYWNSLREETGL